MKRLERKNFAVFYHSYESDNVRYFRPKKYELIRAKGEYEKTGFKCSCLSCGECCNLLIVNPDKDKYKSDCCFGEVKRTIRMIVEDEDYA